MLGNLASPELVTYVVFYFTTIKTFFFFFSKRKKPPSLLPHPPQWTWVAPSNSGPLAPPSHTALATSIFLPSALPRCPPFRAELPGSSSLTCCPTRFTAY